MITIKFISLLFHSYTPLAYEKFFLSFIDGTLRSLLNLYYYTPWGLLLSFDYRSNMSSTQVHECPQQAQDAHITANNPTKHIQSLPKIHAFRCVLAFLSLYLLSHGAPRCIGNNSNIRQSFLSLAAFGSSLAVY